MVWALVYSVINFSLKMLLSSLHGPEYPHQRLSELRWSSSPHLSPALSCSSAGHSHTIFYPITFSLCPCWRETPLFVAKYLIRLLISCSSSPQNLLVSCYTPSAAIVGPLCHSNLFSVLSWQTEFPQSLEAFQTH